MPNTNPADAILALLATWSYGMMINTIAIETHLPKPVVVATLKSLESDNRIVSNKVARNAKMFALPHSCGWSSYVANERGIKESA